MHQQLCRRIQAACYSIKVFDGDEAVGSGTAFAFLPTGQLLTAAHVVEGADLKIIGHSAVGPASEYGVVRGMTVIVPGFRDAIKIDIAVLMPKTPPSTPVPHLMVNAGSVPAVGQEVLLAGYSEETELPFELNRLLDSSTPGAAQFFQAMGQGYDAAMGNLMIKRGMIGNVRSFLASSDAGPSVAGDIFYIDNALHSGGSGGPVVSEAGDVIGVVTQRAVTKVSTRETQATVPSGSTLALSTRVLTSLNTFTLR